MLPQFYTGASKSSRIKPARQEPAVTGVIFKHLTVHETLKSCLAPSSIPARSSGRLRRRRSLLFPRQGGNGICPAAPRRHPRYLQQQHLGGTGSEHRGTAPHTHRADRRGSPSPEGLVGEERHKPSRAQPAAVATSCKPPAAQTRCPCAARSARLTPSAAGEGGGSGRPKNRSEVSGRGGTAAARGPARGHPAQQQSPARGFPGRHSPAGQPRGRGAPGALPGAGRAGPGRAPAGAGGDSRPRPGNRAEAAAGPR